MESGDNVDDLKARTRDAVREHYRSDPGYEWHRLERHRTEHAVTLRALADHLPAPPARVLDCGCGPGRYAIGLAKQGYEVTLFDLSPELLVMAQENAAEAGVSFSEVVEGTATDLSCFDDAGFDAVLVMGPLYHLLDSDSRSQALVEASRVVKPGGPVLIAFISRYAGHIYGAAEDPNEAVDHPELYERVEQTGVLPPRDDGTGGFVAYFTHPSEIQPLCADAGLNVDVLLGVEGLTSQREEKINTLTGDAWQHWVDINYRIAHDPCILGGVEHLLAVCHRPKWRSVLAGLAERLAEANVDYRLVGGAALAAWGVDVEVRDLDFEMDKAAAYAFEEQFADAVVFPVAWRESDAVRSHYGRFEVDGVKVDVMAGLEWKIDGRWVPSLASTRASVMVDGVAVLTLSLEEETLSCLRRGRLERAAAALPTCDEGRLLAILRQVSDLGWI